MPFLACSGETSQDQSPAVSLQPNIILMMADDLGWGDVGYNGNELIRTPAIDQLARSGISFNRFCAAAPICSPTRFSCLTGRHPQRAGIFSANVGHLPKEELSLAEFLKAEGYVTGHFGKWHLGTLTTEEVDANRGRPGDSSHYSPPWENGFDVSFSTESKVPTWNPMVTPSATSGDIGRRTPGEPFGTAFWEGPGRKATENLEGDASRIIMDRVVPFIETAADRSTPFLAVIWFHTPHLPTLTGEEYRRLYSEQSADIQHFYGAISAMDRQIGRLRNLLRDRELEQDTIWFFTSDNGPEGATRAGRTQGSTRGLRGRKRSLHEGGIRVPGFLYWPSGVSEPREFDFPISTSDYFPTILDVLQASPASRVAPIDGTSLLPYITGRDESRSLPIAFEFKNQLALIGDRFKLYSGDSGSSFELFDIVEDPAETEDIASAHPEIVEQMKRRLEDWQASCKASREGADY
jgi:arylsulfatase A-like enzyme